MGDQFFVPADFAVPGGLTAGEFRLEPLGAEHNAADYAAWTASIGHIQATPGFAGTGWPHPMSLAENLRDLERHAQDFAGRRGFTYRPPGSFQRKNNDWLSRAVRVTGWSWSAAGTVLRAGLSRLAAPGPGRPVR